MKKSLILSIVIFFLSFTPVLAEDCFSSLSGDQTVSPATSCTLLTFLDPNDVDRYVSGVDTGTGNTNTAKITVSSGTMTIDTDETLILGTMEVTGGSVAVAEGAIVKVGSPMWMIDQDGDHYPANEYIHYTASAPTNGVRLNTITNIDSQDCEDDNVLVQGGGTTYYEDSDGDGYGTSSPAGTSCGSAPDGYVTNNTDCNDTGTNSENVMYSATCYLDSDDDGYGTTTSYSCTSKSDCAFATWASNGDGTTASSGNFASNNTDCYDSNANAYPGQTTCYTSHRGDGSFDYDCDSSSTGCNTCPSSCNKGAWVWTKGCCGTTCKYCCNASNKQVTSNSGSAACGASGSYSGNSAKTGCTSGGCVCSLSTSKNISCYSCTKSCK